MEEKVQEEPPEGLQSAFEQNPVVQEHYLNNEEEAKVVEEFPKAEPTEDIEELSPSKRVIDPAEMPKEINVKTVEQIIQNKI